MRIHVKKATPDDCYYIATNIRETDRQELEDSCGLSPLDALTKSLDKSKIAWTLMSEVGNPIAMFGVADMQIKGAGAAWLLATDELVDNDAVQPYFLKRCGKYLKKMLKANNYAHLCNWVADYNKVSIKWLEWCGFVGVAKDFKGANNSPFTFMVYTEATHSC